jgi:putative ABC transport system permease protein
VALPRFNLLFLGAFAVLALALAAIGIYGVLSYTVAQRTSEIGVRMALGAAAGRIVGLVVREGLTLVAVGLVAGTGGALAATRLMSSLLYGVEPTDPATFVAIAAILSAVAFGAACVPAWRAARLDPLAALRAE